MFNRSAILTSVLHHAPGWSIPGVRFQLRHAWIIARTFALVFAALMAIMLSLVVLAQTTTSPVRVIDLPEYLLPGSQLPAAVMCAHLYDGTCLYTADFEGKKVHLGYDESSQTVTSAEYNAFEYTVGDLMLAWGIPAGIIQDGRNIEVRWGNRTAYLITCSFQPKSWIGYIEYDLEPKQAAPWRGFTTSKSGC